MARPANTRKRLKDVPLIAFDGTQRPYFLKEGTLAEIAGMVPVMAGGYKRAPQWTNHWTPPTNHTIIGVSPAGAIATGGTAQITVATRESTGPALYQYKVIADGSGSTWGALFGGAQDTSRDKVVYHRSDGLELSLGFDPTAYGYHCTILHSDYAIGHHVFAVEPMDQNGITATPSTTGGHMASGYTRVFLVNKGTVMAGGVSYIGAADTDNDIDVHLTGTWGVNSIALSSIPAGTWPETDKVYIYRTRVVSDSAQLPFEKAYLVKTINAGTTSTTLVSSDASIMKHEEMQTGKADFPGTGTASQFLDNLSFGEHLGHLVVTGVTKGYRMYISGYTDNDGVSQSDGGLWWQYDIELPGRDEIKSWVSHRGVLIVLGENGLYRLRDESADPSNWYLEQMAAIRGEHVNAIALATDIVMIIGRGLGGEWNIWASDGYTLKPIGDSVSGFLDSSTGILAPDGMPMLIGSSTSRNYTMNQRGVWGKNNADTDVKWDAGRDSTFRSGVPMLAGPAGIYYEGSYYLADESDYAVTREFSLALEERSEWEKVFILATKVSTNASAMIYGRVDTGSWVLMDTITISATSGGRYEVAVPDTVRQGYRFQVKVVAADAYSFTLEGVIVQANNTPPMF